MTDSERAILKVFHQYDVTAHQMLCFDGKVVKRFHSGIRSLIERGWICRDRPKDAFYLTPAGYAAVEQLQA